jgi:hypothetical protein
MNYAQSALAYVADRANSNPEYIQFKKELNQFGHKLAFAGVAAIIVGVALAILGIATCFTPSYPFGIVAIGLSMLVFAAAYNSFSLSENLKSVAQNPSLYINQLSLTPQLKSDDLKNQLSRNTFGLKFLINNFVDIIDQEMQGARNS